MKLHIDIFDVATLDLDIPAELVGALIGIAGLLGFFALFVNAV